MSHGFPHSDFNPIRRSALADLMVVGGLLGLYEGLKHYFHLTAGINASGELDGRMKVWGGNLIPGGEWFPTALIFGALVWQLLTHSQPGIFYSLGEIPRMLLEGFGVALVLWVAARLWSRMIPELALLTQDQAVKSVSLLGAAVYEEGVFRILLLGILYELLLHFRTGKIVSAICAITLSALLFSLAHHQGPPQTPQERQIFLFRAASGVLLGIAFLLRGAGTPVIAHTFYNGLADLGGQGA